MESLDYIQRSPQSASGAALGDNSSFFAADDFGDFRGPLSVSSEEQTEPIRSSTEPNVTEFDLERLLGPKRVQLHALLPITFVYCVIFVTGVVGNVVTAIVIKRNKYMHTATNYYLCNLVLSDLLVLILGLPLEIYWCWSAYPWIFGETFCIVRSMAAETSTYASILTITAFTVERYLAICHPMKAKIMSGLSRAVRMIVVVWVVSAGCSVPIWIQYGVVVTHTDPSGRPIPDSAMCTIRPDRQIDHVFELSSIVFFIVPMSVISVLYGLIALSIRRSSLYRASSSEYGGLGRVAAGGGANSGQHSEPSPQLRDHMDTRRAIQQARVRLSVLKMLVAVVVAFFICWAPFHIQRLVSAYASITSSTASSQLIPDINTTDEPISASTGETRTEAGHVASEVGDSAETGTSGAGEVVFFYVSGILYYVSSVINPILYNIMSLKFRQAFRDTITDCCSCRCCSTRRQSDVIGNRRPTLMLMHQRQRQSIDCIDGRQLSTAPASGTRIARHVGRRTVGESSGLDEEADSSTGCAETGKRFRFYNAAGANVYSRNHDLGRGGNGPASSASARRSPTAMFDRNNRRDPFQSSAGAVRNARLTAVCRGNGDDEAFSLKPLLPQMTDPTTSAGCLGSSGGESDVTDEGTGARRALLTSAAVGPLTISGSAVSATYCPMRSPAAVACNCSRQFIKTGCSNDSSKHICTFKCSTWLEGSRQHQLDSSFA